MFVRTDSNKATESHSLSTRFGESTRFTNDPVKLTDSDLSVLHNLLEERLSVINSLNFGLMLGQNYCMTTEGFIVGCRAAAGVSGALL